ncbi:MAG: hypothetical protein LBV78_25890, partial [Kitasatospora sp.]|nr:hypothetical protein [Kitasatospora sp.]
MTDPRDDLDTWLHSQVEPLDPPPGTFTRIRKQARRRKTRRVLVSAVSAGAAAAVIVLAVVALPRVVPSVLHLKSNAASNTSAAGRGVTSASPRASSHAATSAAPTPDSTGSHRVAPPERPAVPANFAATSVTFVSLGTGWVIGQAGTPGHCFNGNTCTSLARTDNGGRTWFGLHAPVTGAPDGGTGVSQIRFLDGVNGWAFGPELFATHDKGQNWTAVQLGGRRVLSLETVGSEAFAVLARCTGTGADFAAGCTRFWLYSTPASSDHWSEVPGTGSVSVPAGSAGSAAVVLTGTQGYWYTPDGMLASGPVTDGASWSAVGTSALPCAPGAPRPDGRPSAGQLAASRPGDLALACPGNAQAGGNQQESIYVSSDGGQHWQPKPAEPIDGTATTLAADGDVKAMATNQGIEVSA